MPAAPDEEGRAEAAEEHQAGVVGRMPQNLLPEAAASTGGTEALGGTVRESGLHAGSPL